MSIEQGSHEEMHDYTDSLSVSLIAVVMMQVVMVVVVVVKGGDKVVGDASRGDGSSRGSSH